jgi:hypothetical protein
MSTATKKKAGAVAAVLAVFALLAAAMRAAASRAKTGA